MVKINILVLGSTGLLGKYLYTKFKLQNECDVYEYSRNNNGNLTENLLISLIKKHKINFIINCIAQTNVNYCEENYQVAYNDNVLTTKIIVSALNKLISDVKLIHISTDHFYNNIEASNESSKIFLLNNYAKTKYESEMISLSYKKSVILRTNFFYDHNHKGFHKFIYDATFNNETIYLYDNIYISPLYIGTLFNVILLICNNFKSGIFNIGSSNFISKYDYGIKLVNHLKLKNTNIVKIEYDNFNNKVKRPLNMSMTSKKFINCYKYILPEFEDDLLKSL